MNEEICPCCESMRTAPSGVEPYCLDCMSAFEYGYFDDGYCFPQAEFHKNELEQKIFKYYEYS